MVKGGQMKPGKKSSDWELDIYGNKIGRGDPRFVKGYNLALDDYTAWIVERLLLAIHSDFPIEALEILYAEIKEEA